MSLNTPIEAPLQVRLSVVIAVHNGGADLQKCLAAIGASAYPVDECILVDDASTDGLVQPLAAQYGARVIRLDRQNGPANARNLGVAEAVGDIIFFTDADVLLHPDAIGLAVDALQADAGLAAVIGSYDDQPAHASFLSQYRNLFHHWVHQTSAAEASTFWTGCGAIRRNILMEMGGFSRAYRAPSVEDIELGIRLRRSGHRIRLLKNMYGQHMKKWRFWNMLRTDILLRGVPWMLLVLREGHLTNDLNLSYKSRLATLLAALLGLSSLVLILTGHGAALLPLAGLLLAAATGARFPGNTHRQHGSNLLTPALTILLPLLCHWLQPDPLAWVPLALLLALIATHLDFNRYVAKKRGMAFAFAVVPMQLLFFLGCALAIPLAFIRHHLGNRQAPADECSQGDR